MLMHPLPALLNNGVPVALCSDDPAVFGNMGLTLDFYQVSTLRLRGRAYLTRGEIGVRGQ